MPGASHHDGPPQADRPTSTSSLPLLRRKISSGSQKAVKWVGKKLSSRKQGRIASCDLGGISRDVSPRASFSTLAASSGSLLDLPDEWPTPPSHPVLVARGASFDLVEQRKPIRSLSAEKKNETDTPLNTAAGAKKAAVTAPESNSERTAAESNSDGTASESTIRSHRKRVCFQPLPIAKYKLTDDLRNILPKKNPRPSFRPQPTPPASVSSLSPPAQPRSVFPDDYKPLAHQTPLASVSSLSSPARPRAVFFPDDFEPLAHQTPPASSSSLSTPPRPRSVFPEDYTPLAHKTPPASVSPLSSPRRLRSVFPDDYTPLAHETSSGSTSSRRALPESMPAFPPDYIPLESTLPKRSSLSRKGPRPPFSGH